MGLMDTVKQTIGLASNEAEKAQSTHSTGTAGTAGTHHPHSGLTGAAEHAAGYGDQKSDPHNLTSNYGNGPRDYNDPSGQPPYQNTGLTGSRGPGDYAADNTVGGVPLHGSGVEGIGSGNTGSGHGITGRTSGSGYDDSTLAGRGSDSYAGVGAGGVTGTGHQHEHHHQSGTGLTGASGLTGSGREHEHHHHHGGENTVTSTGGHKFTDEVAGTTDDFGDRSGGLSGGRGQMGGGNLGGFDGRGEGYTDDAMGAPVAREHIQGENSGHGLGHGHHHGQTGQTGQYGSDNVAGGNVSGRNY